jgi:hypothetical protein
MRFTIKVISKVDSVHSLKAYRGAELELHSFLTLVIYVVKLDLKERNNLGFISFGMAILNLKKLNLAKLIGVISGRFGSVG